MRKLLFVDRDGTILVEPEDQQIDSLAKMKWVPGAILGLRDLSLAGWQLILVSNQDGLGTASFPIEDFDAPQQAMVQLLASCGVVFLDHLICPHLPSAHCDCRKPRTGLLRDHIIEGFDRDMSAVIGDRESDLELAEALGVKGFRLTESYGWADIVSDLKGRPRQATVLRKTKETELSVRVDLDHYASPRIRSGQKFFDHMLEQIAQHAGVDIELKALGDWDVDDHHAIEDSALALGECLRKALGDKHGIARYGFTLPMDETLASCTLDLSGRPYSSYEADYSVERVGGLATEMIPHFFRSLADGLRASLHIKISGSNNHHIVEAGFKAFGRCLGQAVAKNGNLRVPSSKGVL
ncbi:MAG: bifunctional histidinol-phosphatase/imidazoleglycerol-phosphate dehydratase HisB [Oligoflexus sp.]|nr:bifunctional histidinol-phosphatase/imidazoleglycerol-phosphate dehydratase HisB [Oligoflexus sp.]